MGTDAEWERWGKRDPYYGVYTHDKFRSKNITEEAKAEFFASGKKHVDHVMQVVRRQFDQGFSPKRVLEFGCGTGRVALPLSEIAEQVVGIDVSESMLKEAQKNCEKYAVTNVTLARSDDGLSSLEGGFDLIHSFIVFQHIPVERGRNIFVKLLTHLSAGGIGVVQFLYAKARYQETYGAVPIRKFRSLFIGLRELACKILRGVKGDPEMQMNPYNLNDLFFLMQTSGIKDFFVEYTDHGGELGVILYFQKPVGA